LNRPNAAGVVPDIAVSQPGFSPGQQQGTTWTNAAPSPPSFTGSTSAVGSSSNSNNMNNPTSAGSQPGVRRLSFTIGPGGLTTQNGDGTTTTIPLPPGAATATRGSPRVTINGTSVPVNVVNNNMPAAVSSRITLPRLQPQVLPEAQQEWNDDLQNTSDSNSNNNNGSSSDDHASFKCDICYEIMNDPVGCGKCSARFCSTCLQRVAELSTMQNRQRQHMQQLGRQQQQQQQTDENNAAPKCPVCRSEIASPENIIKDTALRQSMEAAPPIACRYRGCPERLQLTGIAAHEAACPHVRVQCRYQSVGCEWKGKRCDLRYHEDHDCQLAKVSGLVDRVRQTHAECFHRLGQLAGNQQMHATISEWQRLREVNPISVSHYGQVCNYVYFLLCLTPRFLVTKDTWKPFGSTTKGRAAVANFLPMLPTNILMAKTGYAAYQQMLHASISPLETEEEILQIIDGVLYLLIVICLAIIIGISFFADTGTAEQWQNLPIPLPRRFFTEPCRIQILMYAASFAIVAAHSFAFDFSASKFILLLSWSILCFASTFIPALVTSMAETVDRPARIEVNVEAVQRILFTGKATKPVWLGLIYAPWIVLMGPLATIDAAVVLYLCQNNSNRMAHSSIGKLWLKFEGDVLPTIHPPFLYVFAGLRLAMRANDFPGLDLLQSLDFLSVTLLIMLVKWVLLSLVQVGISTGSIIVNQSRLRVINANATANASLLQADYHGTGLALFGAWFLSLGAVMIT